VRCGHGRRTAGYFWGTEILRPLPGDPLATPISKRCAAPLPSFAHPGPAFIRMKCALQLYLHSIIIRCHVRCCHDDGGPAPAPPNASPRARRAAFVWVGRSRADPAGGAVHHYSFIPHGFGLLQAAWRLPHALCNWPPACCTAPSVLAVSGPRPAAVQTGR
jgi:hypothetical protein